MLKASEFQHKTDDAGNPIPSFVQILAEEGIKKLTLEVFLKEDFPAVLFCIYLNGEGEYACNTLNEAIDEYNQIIETPDEAKKT